MAYGKFTLEMIKTRFGITIAERAGIFADVPSSSYSQRLAETLNLSLSLALAISTEKARSELIVAPLLLELKQQLGDRISLFSGNEFTVDVAQGLEGYCDFLISQSPEQLMIEAPVITVVEAKNDNIQSGLGQCMAEMVAAQLFNQRRDNPVRFVYGVVTTGSNWKFMRLHKQEILVDLSEYFISDVGKILGILKFAIASNSTTANSMNWEVR